MKTDLALAEPPPAAYGVGAAPDGLEREVVEFFVHMADLLGLPRSVGELYGGLFLAPGPVPMDDLMARLRLSKGATSQGLRLLRSFGAVRTVYVSGDRRDHFVAETEMRKLAAGFLNEQVRPHLVSGGERLRRIEAELAALPRERQAPLKDRVERLKRWRRRAERLLPVVMRLIQRD